MPDPVAELKKFVDLCPSHHVAAGLLHLSLGSLEAMVAGRRPIPDRLMRGLGYQQEIVSVKSISHTDVMGPPKRVIRRWVKVGKHDE